MSDEERRRSVIEQVARERRVERFVLLDTHAWELDANRQDLVQMVYEILLTYDCDKVLDMWDTGCLDHFIFRIVTVQWYGARSTFDNLIRRPREIRAADMTKYER